MSLTDCFQATKRSIINAGGKEDINAVVADVTDASGREKIVSSTVQKWGRIDILVSFNIVLLLSTTLATYLSELHIYLSKYIFSVVHLIQLARPHLVKAKGEVVNVSSIAGQPKGVPSQGPKFMYYAMSKAALDQMTRSLAVDLIAEGVRVNSVSPGAVVTRFLQTAGASDADASKFYDTFASSADSLPIREIGQPEDIANVIAFLADRKASRYIIGQTIIADGGSMLVTASDVTAFSDEFH
ncbi:oxidoreductase, short chain dehydrogenase/reductase family protein [Ancylostoma duodenale]|uniref:Oxidoreductase, short chain dehydrogenase/reductase family protein n=1 Tax=Ancylostoma duodenale TaxID=51022 RepID=A0A0C2DFM0_9BILA|nr:oxidoreductase, short chain dehydrogenase/reductase family protein [Ancylostoma duodenale]